MHLASRAIGSLPAISMHLASRAIGSLPALRIAYCHHEQHVEPIITPVPVGRGWFQRTPFRFAPAPLRVKPTPNFLGFAASDRPRRISSDRLGNFSCILVAGSHCGGPFSPSPVN